MGKKLAFAMVPIGAGLLALAAGAIAAPPKAPPPKGRLRRRDHALFAADAGRRAQDVPLRHLRQRGVLGRRAAAAQGDRRRRRTAASAPASRPKTALAVGLKVDADALPDALKKQLKAGKVNLDDPATTLALLKLNAVVGVTAIRRRQAA